MKCQSCQCLVPSDFTHSYHKNCCPKCGKSLMEKDVQKLWIELNDVLSQENNDVGDLAVYLYSKFSPKEEIKTEEIKVSESLPEVEGDIIFAKDFNKPKKSFALTSNPMKPASLPKEDPNKEANERRKVFAKRAGIDSSKYEELVKHIKGERKSDIGGGASFDISEGAEELDDGNYEDIDTAPLSPEEMGAISNLFDTPEDNMEELDKLRKFEEGGGAFRRSN